MGKKSHKEDAIYQTARKLMDKGAAVFELGQDIRLFVTLKHTNGNWLMDTYLFSENKPNCYSSKSITKLRELAANGQFSDGVREIVRNDRQGFALLFVDDLASGFFETVLIWV